MGGGDSSKPLKLSYVQAVDKALSVGFYKTW